VEVLREKNDNKILVATLGTGDFFGEMAIFESETRSASVRAKRDVRVLTIDKKNFLRRIHQDPSIAYRLVNSLIDRLRAMHKALDVLVPEGTFNETIRFGKK
jgi:CRP-like cAMP-binding protein